MIYFRRILSLFVTIVLFYSCTSVDIDYIKPVTAKKLVAFCFFNPDSIWSVKVSKLGSVTDINANNLLISNAIVTIYENNKLVDTLKLKENGCYISSNNLKPEMGKTYRLQVDCNGFESLVSTNETLPSPVRCSKVTVYLNLLPDIFSKETYNDTLWYKQKTVETTLTVEKNQFLKIFATQKLSATGEWGVNISLNNKGVLTEYSSSNGSVFEVQQSKEITLQAAIPYNNNEFCLMTISPHYLLYEVSLAEYENAMNTTKILIPNNIFSNISGGGGLFVGYTLNKFDI